MLRVFVCGLFLALLVSVFTGCGGNSVSGKVTLDGQPLTKGDISFAPKGEGPVATGTIDAKGNYTLQVGSSPTIPAGTYRVTIIAVEPVAPTPEHPEPLPKKLTPDRYSDPKTSGLEREVKAGKNSIDFDLQSMPMP